MSVILFVVTALAAFELMDEVTKGRHASLARIMVLFVVVAAGAWIGCLIEGAK